MNWKLELLKKLKADWDDGTLRYLCCAAGALQMREDGVYDGSYKEFINELLAKEFPKATCMGQGLQYVLAEQDGVNIEEGCEDPTWLQYKAAARALRGQLLDRWIREYS